MNKLTITEVLCSTMEPKAVFVHTGEEWPGPAVPIHLELVGNAWFDEKSEIESCVSLFLTEAMIEEIVIKLAEALDVLRASKPTV